MKTGRSVRCLAQRMESLYVHFPFCETKCHYCDFYSLGREKTKTTDAPLFEEALRLESLRQANLLSPTLNSIFFGGGTPSMTPPESMERALAPLNLRDRITSETEWTMEANPSSVDLENLKAYHSIGVNRVSMGVQALNDELLLRLGRVHSRNRAFEALQTIFKSGIDNVSVDLLCGVPGQTLDHLKSALKELTDFPIKHLSCYLLTLPPHHKMYKDLPSEDTQLQHLLTIHEWMAERGFRHYEISNFAKPGFEARHNLNYWKGASYLGLGPSAHSFDAKMQRRWKNLSSLHQYSKRLQAGEAIIDFQEDLTPSQKELETWMLTLRLDDGFPEGWLATQGQKSKAKAYFKEGLLERHPAAQDRLRLTPKGFALSDQVILTLAGSIPY